MQFVFPTAPVRTVSAIKSNTTAWFDAYDIESFKLGKKDEAGIASAVEMVSKLVDGELTAGVPSERIVVGGYSNGGCALFFPGNSADRQLVSND
jgi:predicted esterase